MAAAKGKGRRTVADLVPAKAAPQLRFAPDQREQVQLAFEINDKGGGLTAVQVWKLLRDEYGFKGSRETFCRICDREFGRQVRV